MPRSSYPTTEDVSPTQRPTREAELRFADVTMDLLGREAVRGETVLDLSPLEYRLLLLFVRSPGEAFSREQLCEMAWRHGFEGRSNHVDVAIMGLRRKLEAGGRPRLLQTVRGYGYVLRLRIQSSSTE